ncbi:hypothetical protein K402DRAFT_388556 [Aulographum hederae CBS 113979]|uniref:DnaJ homologue subfamily C member 28 conserved domain-containing protein n=1 Tax=Aulographum hederae CBS 113979 TaxID=1176131 RepID=A0A6G1HG40_9PEZI|nr:hypothetical protein K402DRAFT_388556 [Aulographum hederae CBS 113979]
MPIATSASQYVCARCLRARTTTLLRPHTRVFSSSPPERADTVSKNKDGPSPEQSHGKEKGAMSQRLEQMSEEGLESGGRSARNAVQEAGFDEDLRKRLEEKIAGANFRNEYASAIARAELPESAGRGTRDIAGARPWTGTESVEDAALRMLTDSHKPLRSSVASAKKGAPIRGAPTRVDTGRARSKTSSGTRLANARDRTSIYNTLKDPEMSERERESYRKEMKERFMPAARAIPATITGLSSLANERIENAIARGQFKNLPRGQKIERDYNASSPFIDTTEYLMNKMIQKQDIVPPWIEKQQELISNATKFRARLRNDWKRHAARTIASAGGTLQDQIRRAEGYAAAEAVVNPTKKMVEQINTVDSGGHLSQISLAGELKVTTHDSSPSSKETEITVTETTLSTDGSPQGPTSTPETVTITTQTPEHQSSPLEPTTSPTPSPPINNLTHPFRDPTWESTEHPYLTASIAHLNSLCRSYNLMAPDLAKKPYYSLPRELKSCFADVAPLLPQEIRERATRPRKLMVEVVGHRPGGVLEKFGGQKARVWDEEERKSYGFKQFWRDLFA